MARIAGVDIPEKRLEISLTYIFGIGRTTAEHLRAGRHRPEHPGAHLTDEEVNRIRGWIDEHLKVEGDLRRDVQQDIKRKMEIGCYQGLRHRRGLPCGQRTHTNARTRKGPKKTVAGKKKVMSNGQKPAARQPSPRKGNVASPMAWRTSELVQQHDRLRSPTRTATSWRGPRPPATSASGAPASRPRSRPAGRRAGRPPGDGARVRKVDVVVKGPARAVRRPSLDPERRHRGHRHQGRDPVPPQRLPPPKRRRN